MSRIRGRDTGPERTMADLLAKLPHDYETHAKDLPGRPDFVFRLAQVVVFVDGDFWHGWRFPVWRLKLSEKWEAKIEATRKRDKRNHAKLRRAGWTVVRVWEHQLKRQPDKCLDRVRRALAIATGDTDGNLVFSRRDSR